MSARGASHSPPDTTRKLLDHLSDVKNRFTPADRHKKADCLRALQTVEILDASSLIQLHEILCFLRAYPDDPEILALTEDALAKFALRVDLVQANSSSAERKKLRDSGIVHTTVYYPYPYEMARWLVEHFPQDVELDWEDESGLDKVRAILPFVVTYLENDALDDERVSLWEWMKAAKGSSQVSDLQWLLNALNRSTLPPEVVRHLYNDAELLLGWKLREATASRTLAKFPPERIIYQKSPLLRAEADFWRTVQEPLPVLTPLAQETGETLIHLFRCALSVRHREFHPLLHANPQDVWMTSTQRGLRIVLVGVLPEFRLPLEGYYSFLVLKNGIPVGYGGGAPLLDRLEFAGNIFETFRQGESIFVFSQVFRAFYQLCGSRSFLVPRYQVGHENAEALSSGAFWFYYKLGFRPEQPDILRLSEQERSRVTADPSYRSSSKMLARLAQSDLAFHLTSKGNQDCHALRPADLALLVTKYIQERGGGDRATAVRAATKRVARSLGIADRRRWPAPEQRALERLSPLLVLMPDLARWSPSEKRALIQIVKAKGGPRESEYVRLVRHHARLTRALVDLARSSPSAPLPSCARAPDHSHADRRTIPE